jgi:hypothetical protein
MINFLTLARKLNFLTSNEVSTAYIPVGKKMLLYINYFENMRPQTLTTTKLLVNGQGINLWVRVSGVLLYRPIGRMPPKKCPPHASKWSTAPTEKMAYPLSSIP